jgi:hypothetical protein
MNISSYVAWYKKNWLVIAIVIIAGIVVYKYYKSKKIEKSAEKQIAFVKPPDMAPPKPMKQSASDKAFQDGMSEDNVSGLGDVKM